MGTVSVTCLPVYLSTYLPIYLLSQFTFPLSTHFLLQEKRWNLQKNYPR